MSSTERIEHRSLPVTKQTKEQQKYQQQVHPKPLSGTRVDTDTFNLFRR